MVVWEVAVAPPRAWPSTERPRSRAHYTALCEYASELSTAPLVRMRCLQSVDWSCRVGPRRICCKNSKRSANPSRKAQRLTQNGTRGTMGGGEGTGDERQPQCIHILSVHAVPLIFFLYPSLSSLGSGRFGRLLSGIGAHSGGLSGPEKLSERIHAQARHGSRASQPASSRHACAARDQRCIPSACGRLSGTRSQRLPGQDACTCNCAQHSTHSTVSTSQWWAWREGTEVFHVLMPDVYLHAARILPLTAGCRDIRPTPR